MALDLQQQEELERVKSIWHGGLKWCVLVLLCVALVYLCFVALSNYRHNKNEQATDLLITYQTQMQHKKEGEALKTLQILQDNYADTPAASIATTTEGLLAFYNGRLTDAERHFQWVYDHQHDEFVHVSAVINLVNVKLSEKKFDEALRLTDKKVAPELDFLLNDLRGDIYIAKGDKKLAVAAYNQAIATLPKPNPVVSKEDIEQIRSQIEAKKIINLTH